MITKLTLFSALFAGCLTAFAQAPSPTATPEQTPPKEYRGPVSAGPAKPPGTIAGGVLNGKAISLPTPIYPPAALAAKVEGAVAVQVLIDEEGKIISATAVSGNDLLKEAAVTAAKGALFSPTKLSGNPVKVMGIITYNFVAGPPPLKVIGLRFGMYMSVIRANDAEILSRLAGKPVPVFLGWLARNNPAELKTEQPLLDQLAAADELDRPDLAAKILDSINTHVSDEEKWGIKMGGLIGNIMVEMMRMGKTRIADDVPLKTENLVVHLKQINDLLRSIPAGISPDVAEKYKKLEPFAADPALGNDDRLDDLWKTVLAALNKS